MLDRAALAVIALLAVAKIWGIIRQHSLRAFKTVPLIHPWFVVCRLEHKNVSCCINKHKFNS